MYRGERNKATRGEFTLPPIGYLKLSIGRFELDPDEQVQAIVRLIFDEFDRQGSSRPAPLSRPSWDPDAGPAPRRPEPGHSNGGVPSRDAPGPTPSPGLRRRLSLRAPAHRPPA